MPEGSLSILSCGLGTLPLGEDEALFSADVIYGGKKLLPLVADLCSKPDLRPLAAKAAEDAATALDLAIQGRQVVILASGDALFHGMGGVLARLLPRIPEAQCPIVRFVPGITAFQALFHKLGLPWDQARLFSIHNGMQHADALPLRAMLEAPLAVIYAGSTCTAAQLAAALLHTFPEAAERRAVLADALNTDMERIEHGTLEHLCQKTTSPTSILLLLPENAKTLPLTLGLPVDAFEREAGLITAPEVRAVILSKLRLPAWGHLWDIGAGSGSIGLEAAGLRPGLQVTAVERAADRVAMIRRNALRLGLANHQTLIGTFPDDFPGVLPALESQDRPAPDRIVIGGGGVTITAMLDVALSRLAPGGHMVVPVVTLESQHRLYPWRPDLRTALLTVQTAEERPLAGSWHHLEPQRPIHLYCYAKP